MTLHLGGPWGLRRQGLPRRLPQREEVGPGPRRDARPLQGRAKGARDRGGRPGHHRLRRHL